MRHQWTIEFARVEWLSTRHKVSSEFDQIPDEAGLVLWAIALVIFTSAGSDGD